jgi:hypothetical protein
MRDADLQRMEAPFVAQLGGEFVIVTEIINILIPLFIRKIRVCSGV